VTPWRWWVGSDEDVEEDGTYSIDDCATREEAILAGLRETRPGEAFHIIEAQCSTARRYEGEVAPFLHSRNYERIIHEIAAVKP
jgi:hypothetical protein